MNKIDLYKDTKLWHKISKEHTTNSLGKKFRVTNCNWSPANKYIGRTGKCVNAYVSPSNANVKFIELDIAPNIAFAIEELTEIYNRK